MSYPLSTETIVAREKPQETAPEKSAEETRFGMRRRDPKMTFGYVGLWLFLAFYFIRPEDYYQPLLHLPIAKIIGAIPALALVVALLTGNFRLRTESKLLLILFAELCMCIPFSGWPGGSFDLLMNQFSKIILITVVLIMVTNTFRRVRQLLLLQIMAIGFLGVTSLLTYHGEGRMYGEGQAFGDPNDLALNICIVIPVCIAFLLTTRNIIKRIFWIAMIGVLAYAILATYSRGGFLAMAAAFLMIIYQFGIKARRPSVLLGGVFGVLLLFVAVAPSGYGSRLSTILNPDSDQSNSAQSRRYLLTYSIEMTAKHPLFGVGPGQFQLLSNWYQTHNTYTQFSAEAGIAALILFLLLIRATFKNLKRTQTIAPLKSPQWIFAAALKCSFVGYLVGAFFLSTGYWFYPYLLMGYVAVLEGITAKTFAQPEAKSETAQAEIPVETETPSFTT